MFLRLAMIGLLAAAALSPRAKAQENPAFFGTWEPFADGDPILTIWPGAFQDSGQPVVTYRVVRDMGDRVLLLKWPPFQREFTKTPTGKGYAFYLLRLGDWELGDDYWKLEYGFCSTVESANHRFPVDDDQKLWQVLLTKNRNCELKDGGRKFGFGWGRLYYLRKKTAGE